MSTPLRVLILEDQPTDAELLVRELRRAGFDPQWQRVDAESEFVTHLDPEPDVILADYALPQFDALRALQLLQERGVDIPCIVVSGSIGEEAAAGCILHGAADLLLKDRLARLGVAVAQALEQRRLRNEKRQAEAELRVSVERYRAVSQLVTNFAYTLRADPDGALVMDWVTEDVTRITGFLPDEVAARGWHALVHPDDQPVVERRYQTLLDGDADVSQYRIVAKDGETRWMLDHARPVWDEAEDRVVRVYGAAQDITERLRAEELLLQFNRALMVLSRCNAVLVRATDELALLREVCHLLVETGGYRLAWVGFARQDVQKSIHPVAYAGLEEGYLETSNFTWADTPHGREPTGTAIRTCAPAVCRNILTDPAFAPWHNDAVRRGYASALALPLTGGNEVLGVLTIYASRPDAFDVEEVRLLTELADNLAYGIMSLRSRIRGSAEATA